MEQNNAEYWGLTGSPGTHCETGDPSEEEEDVEVEEEDVEVDCDDREEDVEEPKYSIVVVICGRCLLIHSARPGRDLGRTGLARQQSHLSVNNI